MSTPHQFSRLVPVACAGIIGASGLLLAGPLNPPAGPITSTHKTLTEVEPRIAINAANTPGDANSVFRITQSGSYYLTGNVAGVAAKHGIEINANGVTVDLNGFDVVGVAGSLDGITSDAAADTGITILNGSVRDFGGSGVNFFSSAARNCILERLHVSGNGGGGISCRSSSAITNCVVSNNGSDGIDCGTGGTITSCIAYQNGRYGIGPGVGSTVVDCAAYINTLTGISAAAGCTIVRCTSRANGEHGIGLSGGCSVIDCNASANTANGIRCAGSGNLLRGNICDDNGLNAGDGAGIYVVSSDHRIEGNNCTGNDRGIEVDTAGNFITQNTCANNATNWDVVAGNKCLVVLGVDSAAILGDSGGVSPGSTNPHANYTY